MAEKEAGMSRDDDLGDQIIRALNAGGPIDQEMLWMMADEICRELAGLKSCLITHKPEFCMVKLHDAQEKVYKLRDHLKRGVLQPTE